MDELQPGDEFFAAFPFDPTCAETGPCTVRMVGYADGFDHTRFTAGLDIIDPRAW